MQTKDIFKAGGTLNLGAQSYVTRPADEALLRQVTAGRFCFVFATRQMGKSSLMIRTAELLRRRGSQVAIVDLSSVGSQATPDQWYLGILTQLAFDLRLEVVVPTWWQAHCALGVVQRFVDFISEVVLAQTVGRVVIYFDEIDATSGLDFTDDFFAALRAIYNERAMHPDNERLTFVLLGITAPANLIKERSRTPFNIGQAIDLKEFIRSDAYPLEQGLEHYFPDRGTDLLDRIFYWTDGHPYLTQKLCSAITGSVQRQQPPDGAILDWVDTLVARLFLAENAKNDENLQSIRSRVQSNTDVRSLLSVYQRVYCGETVSEDELSPLQSELMLVGLITSKGGILCVRNEIYVHVFNQSWIDESLLRDPKTLTTYLSPIWRSVQQWRAIDS